MSASPGPDQPSLAEGLTNVEVVTFVLAELGGGARVVHLETIAARAFQLAPGAFRWDLDEFSNFIDKDKVRVSLTDAAKEKFGRLVRAVGAKRGGISKPTDAWQLTQSGADLVLGNQERISRSLGVSKPSLKRGKAAELRGRVQGSPLFAAFIESGRVEESPFEFADLLECSPDASNHVVQEKYDSLVSQVRLLEEAELVQFLEAVADAHRDMLLT